MFANDGDDPGERRSFTRRAALLGLGQTAAFAVLGARLHHLQVTEEPRYSALADDNRIATRPIAPVRGRILDRSGRVLAGNADTFRVLLIPAEVDRPRLVLERLSRLVRLDEATRTRILARIRRTPPHLGLVVAEDLEFEAVAAIGLNAPFLPGVVTEAAGRRLYPLGRTMAHIVGHVGSLERLGLDDEPALRTPGIRIGRLGIERGLDAELRGSGGLERLEVDARGRIVRRLGLSAPKPGSDVTLAIDAGLQARVQARLEQERRAAVVAIDTAAGEVVAMASVPTFDPDAIAAPEKRHRWGSPYRQPTDTMLNRAIRGLYPPGSTVKMVTALAALGAGVLTLGERIHCDGSYEYGGHTFRCWRRSGHGGCDLHRALKESCDCYFYEAARRTGIDALAGMARRLGFGQAHPTGIAFESAGVVPSPEWKRGQTGEPWVGGDTIQTGIGQGYMLATPLQLAVMTARIATGRQVVPTLVRQRQRGRAPFEPLGIEPAHLEAVRRGMLAVVEEGGTGGNARLERSGIAVAGKTGTSQVVRLSASRGGELPWEHKDHALFVGYVPAAAPRLAVAAVVEHGGGGGAAAAPLARDLMDLILDHDLSSPALDAVGAPVVRRS
jgi:penicillin-binding protein 2